MMNTKAEIEQAIIGGYRDGEDGAEIARVADSIDEFLSCGD
jgi:hypothetical protein